MTQFTNGVNTGEGKRTRKSSARDKLKTSNWLNIEESKRETESEGEGENVKEVTKKCCRQKNKVKNCREEKKNSKSYESERKKQNSRIHFAKTMPAHCEEQIESVNRKRKFSHQHKGVGEKKKKRERNVWRQFVEEFCCLFLLCRRQNYILFLFEKRNFSILFQLL